jgi:ATP-dependent Lon protease
MPDPDLDGLIQSHFEDVSIDKRLSRQVSSGDRAIPDYVSDWLVSRYSSQGQVDKSRISAFLARHLPDKRQKESLLLELKNGGTLKLLDAYSVRVDVEADRLVLDIPCLDTNSATIADGIVDQHPLLLCGNVWGSGTIVRQPRSDIPEKYEMCMTEFKPMQTSIVDLGYFCAARHHFTLRQWRELLIRSTGLNPEAYTPEQQLHLLTRLCPLVQPRVNLIELAPKGTGKSHVFSRLSRYAWLISGGVVTRAQLFFNMASRTPGVITRYDAVVLDEIQTIKLTNSGEIVGALKGYLEQGDYRVMQFQGTAEAGFVLLANIPMTANSQPKDRDLFATLPEWLCGASATALLDRFHGMLPGWELRKIDKECLCNSMALKADYFGEVLHALRLRPEYMQWVRDHVRSTGNIRDIVAVERIAAGFLKLLFPDLATVTPQLFSEYCLEPAKRLRQLIRNQMALLDEEYKPNLADISLHI